MIIKFITNKIFLAIAFIVLAFSAVIVLSNDLEQRSFHSYHYLDSVVAQDFAQGAAKLSVAPHYLYKMIMFFVALPMQDLLFFLLATIFLLLAITLLLIHRRSEDLVKQKIMVEDILTKLPNRVAFVAALHAGIKQARAQQQHLGLIYIDLDRFKNINDDMGHEVGDKLLLQIATGLMWYCRLDPSLRGDDGKRKHFIARIGGDAFALIISNLAGRAELQRFAERLHAELSRIYKVENNEASVTVSVGAALSPYDAADPLMLMKYVELALYFSKEQGGNTVTLFSKELLKERMTNLHIENALAEAINRDELYLVYQPQFSLQTERIIGIEVLVRWQHPHLGLVSPDKFIKIAESSELIVEISNWIFAQACNQLSMWYGSKIIDSQIKVALNVSPRYLLQKNFKTYLQQLLTKYNLKPKMLELEITETAVMKNFDKAQAILADLNQDGFVITIDDYGSGFASLNYLRNLPISKLKIDKSFIDNVVTNYDDQVIVKSTLKLAQDLNLNVIAEGAETRQQIDFLKANGCPSVQGYFYSKPLSADEMTARLAGEATT